MTENASNDPKQTPLNQAPSEQQQQPQQQHHRSAMQDMAKNVTSEPTSAQTQSQSQRPASAETVNFLSGYQPGSGGYDEAVDATGQQRPNWQMLGESMGRLGPSGMNHRIKQIRRMIEQHGIAYNAYRDPALRPEQRQLDPLPQLIAASEWENIERAMRQRADLFNRLLMDLYGSRTLLTDGVIPPEVLLQHPQYQLPFHGLPPAGHRHLHFYSAELIRSPQGDWWVTADHTDCPAGSGFALENRIVVSRAFPNEFRRCNVQRLAPYFVALREHLTALARPNREHPHIAILSTGGGSPTYFEDSFLARYLGFTLVEANDLVVRSGRVMLKTLSGLAPIDVILRRRSGSSIDPLELGGDESGVPGILQVIRDGNLAMVNGPETGLVESPIFMAFLPRICQALTGGDLQLPGIATWWGGEPASLELMLDRIDDVTLMPAYRTAPRSKTGTGETGADAKLLSSPQNRQQRQQLLRSNPRAWVAQENVVRSSVPVWEQDQLQKQFLSTRYFLAASGNAWQSLPGGLGHIASNPMMDHDASLTMAHTKDVWVLADKPVEPGPLLQPGSEQVKPTRSHRFIPSRIADNLCWLGRFVARADYNARLIRAIAVRLTGETDPADAPELPVLVANLNPDSNAAAPTAKPDLDELELELPQALLDVQNVNSLASIVDQVFLLASRVRERLSGDAWRIVQEIRGNFDVEKNDDFDLSDLLDLTDSLIVHLASFSGMINESMTRTYAFQFLRLGRHLEQALLSIRLIKRGLAQPAPMTAELLEAVLEVADSGMTYRSRYYANLQLPAVLDLLLMDETNPRSLAFQLVRLNQTIESLPGNHLSSEFSQEQRMAMDGLHAVRMADPVGLCKLDSSGQKTALFSLLGKLETQLPEIATSISNRFLVHSGPVQQLIGEFRLASPTDSV